MTRVAQNLLLFTAATVWGGSGCTLINDVIGSEKRDVYRFDHPFVVEDSCFRRSLEALGNPMVSGNLHDRRDSRRRAVLPKSENNGGVLVQAIKASRGDASSLAKMMYYVTISRPPRGSTTSTRAR